MMVMWREIESFWAHVMELIEVIGLIKEVVLMKSIA